MVLGFLGVGHLASYTIEGLRAAGDLREIVLSPRNAAVATDVAQRFNCEVASSNQAVVDASDAVVVSVRPAHYPALLDGIRFKSGQLVISAMAGVSLAQLQEHSNLADTELVRSLPIQCAAVGVGPVPVFPASAKAQALLQALGRVVVLANETQFETASAIGCMHGWVYPWLAHMFAWAEDKGLDNKTASELIMASVEGAVAFSQAKGGDQVAAIGESIAGEGTYTLKGLQYQQQQKAFEAWTGAMDLTMKLKQ